MASAPPELHSPQRRRIAALIAAACCGLGIGAPLRAAPPAPPSGLGAFLDVLLPRDALSGSATDLQVDLALWQFARDDPRFSRLLDLGCAWLDMTGGPPFARLDTAQRNAVVAWMAGADWNALPRRFYALVREVALELYYSDPRAWAGLPIQRPPQPLGYPPPWN